MPSVKKTAAAKRVLSCHFPIVSIDCFLVLSWPNDDFDQGKQHKLGVRRIPFSGFLLASPLVVQFNLICLSRTIRLPSSGTFSRFRRFCFADPVERTTERGKIIRKPSACAKGCNGCIRYMAGRFRFDLDGNSPYG